MNFENYTFPKFLHDGLKAKKFETPTAVQEKIIPQILKGKSVVGQSQTGSGKTLAFLLPLLARINPEVQDVQVVITAPSRELANQIYHEAQFFANFSDAEIRVSRYVGGTDKKRQIAKLNHQQPHLAIGTPGRLLDLTKEQALKVHTAFALVIDEADMTLDFGFLGEVDQLAAAMSSATEFYVFSATIPEKLRPFLKKYLENPTIVEIDPAEKIATSIENILVSTKGKDKNRLIYQLLTLGQPYLAFVFANTRQRVEELGDYLKGKGLKVAKIHGDMPARERTKVMKQIQNLDYQFVVATDLAARGIDIEGISLVINDDLPQDLSFFIHRVGRTGRNNLPGTAITLYAPSEENLIVELEGQGITFVPQELKGGELVTSYDRNRREKRQRTNQKELDPTLKGLVKKKKKKIKPGYKKEIQRAVEQKRKQDTKMEKRQQERTRRKKKKSNSEY
ncbi:DEAD/DEAH box helicase [Enterococcus nangangensis]|uniref:DEAD/DEAH box helicase n=1 Tax=Enterococcus nangangensis TaxID=2559926 RepID=UPI0010F691A6|nr:DEAD/DEAH box helicase [Enterococcus nangangensis]